MPRVHVNGITLYYELEGSGKETILFLHGLGTSGASWALQKRAFAPHYRLLTVDVRGHGRSAKPPGPYSVSQFTQDIKNMLDQLQLERVHIVGLSMGGMIGFQLSIDHPERVRSLTICNSGPELIPNTIGDRFKLWQRYFWISFLPMAKVGESIGRRLFPEPEQRPLLDLFLEEFRQNPRPAYRAAFKALVGWSVREHLPQLSIPVLVISSDMDYTPVALKKEYAAEIPGAELLVIKNSRHATPVDQPEAFNTAVASFLQRVG